MSPIYIGLRFGILVKNGSLGSVSPLSELIL